MRTAIIKEDEDMEDEGMQISVSMETVKRTRKKDLKDPTKSSGLPRSGVAAQRISV